MVELGHGMAAMGAGNFYATPSPAVKLEQPKALWHWGKVLFEKYWLATGATREFYRVLMTMGGKSLGQEVRL
jgi:hypothetical protein